MENKNIFDDFTNRYSLSKTLRFELKPVGKDGSPLSEEDATKLLKLIRENDKKIKQAYFALKPVMDKIHENVINKSLTSNEAKEIGFSTYFEKYKNKNELNSEEKLLRSKVAATYKIGIKDQEDFFKITKEGLKPTNKVIDLIHKNTKDFISERLTEQDLKYHLAIFERFFTYFSGYNQNRENYYAKEEKATAVATRIVHDNLPKFCDNCIQFLEGKVPKKKIKPNEGTVVAISRKEEYLNAYQSLKDVNKTTQIKDAETNKQIEAYPIDRKMFEIAKFSECLSQLGIDEYNRIIGHYNLLINLYNQARKEENGFKKLLPFKTLYKQIGCGEKKTLFYAIKYETLKQQQEKKEENENSNEILNLEWVLKKVSEIGYKYFLKSPDDVVLTIEHFIDWLKQTDDWDGIYWSKAAIDIISNKYFANWHEIKDRLKGNKACVSYDRKREEQIKINDAVELSGLFEVLNQENYEGWSKVIFKQSVLEGRQSIIDEKLRPSRNLIRLICADMQDMAKDFCSKSENILVIPDYKNEDNILKIKEWLDTAIAIMQIIKYFEVKESKVKGNIINPELSIMLTALLYSNDTKWFLWYDAVRNFLTKRPQDDAKENKLKLNFGNPILLGGLSDGQEKIKGSVILKNKEKHYVGILIERNIFDTKKKDNPIYKNESDKNVGRLILKNLSFKTLAGKGFKRDFKEKYSEVGERNPKEAIDKLQSFIVQNYLRKYPLLQKVTNKSYSDKKLFDKEVKDILTECYECNFKGIDWKIVLQKVVEEKLFLFEIYSKDFSEKSKGNMPNLQTIYWNHVFQDTSTIQLCGGGEIFFREKAIADENKFTHYKNQPIKRRSDGKTESLFKHDIIKDKRFTKAKYFFHVPIKINYQAIKPNINELVNEIFTNTDDIRFLGIDRGEKHLIYYSLLDVNGNIIEQNNLDVINKKDYLKEINDAAKKRREKQENWQQKGNIKNLKDGYISLVVHEIVQKMKDEQTGEFKPTFIIMEDLNTGFKRSRRKFEQQVYQKFELALAKKLNYLVDKNVPMGEIGSVAKALQLTPPVVNYQDIENKKQVGIMLYTRANYTSVTDPATGWRKTIYLKTGKEEDIKRQIIESFTEIGIYKDDYYFQYSDKNTGKEWRLWSGMNGKSLERYRFRRGNNKNEGVVESYAAKEMLDNLFVDFDKTQSLLGQLTKGEKELSKIDDRTAWESLRFVIDIIQQIRNSGDNTKGQDDNFLYSPVRNDKGEHFDTRTQSSELPKDADANGAYNIARKGIIMCSHIKHWVKDGKQKYEKGPDLDLFITDKEWDMWAIDKEKWKEQLPMFASRKLKGKQR